MQDWAKPRPKVHWRKSGTTAADLGDLHDELKKSVSRKRATLILIDEAQNLADARHDSLAASLRAGLDIRKDAVKVIFTGSSEGALRRMFSRIRQPFYNWAPIEHGSYRFEDTHFAEWVTDR